MNPSAYEILGTLSGVLNVWLTARENIWCWPIGLIYILASYFVFFEAKLYAELLTHTGYLVLTLYGWVLWARGSGSGSESETKEPLPVSTLTKKQILLLTLVNLAIGVLLGFFFARFTDNPYPYLDALLAVLSFTGMGLSARKKIENWPLWGLINFVSIGLYLAREIYLYAGLYLLFLILAGYGYHLWKKNLLPT